MKETRLPTGSSDPVSYTCTCPASNSPEGGLVLLFYRYFGSPPSLPPNALSSISTTELAAFHTDLTQTLHIGGKIRISDEGFNITVGGTHAAIQEYISRCLTHWSFASLPLSTPAQQDAFFKPSPGCACCFDSTCSVRITSEITPMGVTNYVPNNWNSITYLSPAAFHAKCHGQGVAGGEDEEVLLVDVRNHYESRIGYFVSPRTGEKALTPAIRRFAQWPLYVRRRLASSLASDQAVDTEQDEGNDKGRPRKEKAILTYCTGGIRCEKGARFLADTLSTSVSTLTSDERSSISTPKIYTLHGGISAYLSWLDGEIALGHKVASDSLFKGKNYVFDARGAVGLSRPPDSAQSTSKHSDALDQEGDGLEVQQEEAQEQAPVSTCHVCCAPSSRLSKCVSKGCHLILVVCADCELNTLSPPRCCSSCEAMDTSSTTTTTTEPPPTATITTPPSNDGNLNLTNSNPKLRHTPRPICACELERERLLWGAGTGTEGESENQGNGHRVSTAKPARRKKTQSQSQSQNQNQNQNQSQTQTKTPRREQRGKSRVQKGTATGVDSIFGDGEGWAGWGGDGEGQGGIGIEIDIRIKTID